MIIKRQCRHCTVCHRKSRPWGWQMLCQERFYVQIMCNPASPPPKKNGLIWWDSLGNCIVCRQSPLQRKITKMVMRMMRLSLHLKSYHESCVMKIVLPFGNDRLTMWQLDMWTRELCLEYMFIYDTLFVSILEGLLLWDSE